MSNSERQNVAAAQQQEPATASTHGAALSGGVAKPDNPAKEKEEGDGLFPVVPKLDHLVVSGSGIESSSHKTSLSSSDEEQTRAADFNSASLSLDEDEDQRRSRQPGFELKRPPFRPATERERLLPREASSRFERTTGREHIVNIVALLLGVVVLVAHFVPLLTSWTKSEYALLLYQAAVTGVILIAGWFVKPRVALHLGHIMSHIMFLATIAMTVLVVLLQFDSDWSLRVVSFVQTGLALIYTMLLYFPPLCRPKKLKDSHKSDTFFGLVCLLLLVVPSGGIIFFAVVLFGELSFPLWVPGPAGTLICVQFLVLCSAYAAATLSNAALIAGHKLVLFRATYIARVFPWYLQYFTTAAAVTVVLVYDQRDLWVFQVIGTLNLLTLLAPIIVCGQWWHLHHASRLVPWALFDVEGAPPIAEAPPFVNYDLMLPIRRPSDRVCAAGLERERITAYSALSWADAIAQQFDGGDAELLKLRCLRELRRKKADDRLPTGGTWSTAVQTVAQRDWNNLRGHEADTMMGAPFFFLLPEVLTELTNKPVALDLYFLTPKRLERYRLGPLDASAAARLLVWETRVTWFTFKRSPPDMASSVTAKAPNVVASSTNATSSRGPLMDSGGVEPSNPLARFIVPPRIETIQRPDVPHVAEAEAHHAHLRTKLAHLLCWLFVNCAVLAFLWAPYVKSVTQYIAAALFVPMMVLYSFGGLSCALSYRKSRDAIPPNASPKSGGWYIFVSIYNETAETVKKLVTSVRSLEYPAVNEHDHSKIHFLIVVDGDPAPGNKTDEFQLDQIRGFHEVLKAFDISYDSIKDIVEEQTVQYQNVRLNYYHFETENMLKVTIFCKRINMGKRHSMQFCFRYMEMMHESERAKYCLSIDSDTTVEPRALLWMTSTFEQRPSCVACTGETRVTESDTAGFVEKGQAWEYWVGFLMVKGFQSMLGAVMCLPGCFSAYRLSALLEPQILQAFGQRIANTDIYTGNLLKLGEDRYLTLKLLEAVWSKQSQGSCIGCCGYSTSSIVFLVETWCHTRVMTTWKNLVNQRRRWLNSTYMCSLDAFLLLFGSAPLCVKLTMISDFLGTYLSLAFVVHFVVLIIVSAVQFNQSTSPNYWPLIVQAGLAVAWVLCQWIITAAAQHEALIPYWFSYQFWNVASACIYPFKYFWDLDNLSWGTR